MRLLTESRERLGALLFRRRAERELDDELRFHIEKETEANLRRGMNPEEARRRAHLKLGGVEQTKEHVRVARGTRWLEDAVHDARHAIRRLLRERAFSIPAIATLAVGTGVTAAVFALVHAVLLRPLPYAEPDRLVAIRHAAPGIRLAGAGLSRGTFQHYRDHGRVFESVAVYVDKFYALSDDFAAPERMRMALVSPGLLPLLGARPQLGRLPAPASFEPGGRSGVVISHDLWVRRYGADPDVVGRTIEIERSPDVIIGVARPGFAFPDGETDVWIGWQHPASPTTRASVRDLYMTGIARLRPGVSLDDADRDLSSLVRTLPDAYPDISAADLRAMGLRARAVPLKDAIVGDVRPALLLLLATAGFLLLITWANVTNLSLIRAERGRREVAVARALGATGGRLARRLATEALMLAAVAGALALAFAYVAVELRFGFTPDQIPRLRHVRLDAAVIGLTTALSALGAGLVGTVSLLGTRRPALGSVLTGSLGRATAGRREQTGRRVLVAAQVALALTLLIGSALMARSFQGLRRAELGFEPEGVLTVSLPIAPGAYSNYRAMAGVHHELLGRLRALPGVDAVEAATMSAFPLTPVPSYYEERIATADAAGAALEDAPYALFGFATPGYFRAVGIPLLRGRAFRPVDTALETPGVILSDGLARALFGGADPVGRRVRWARTSRYPDYTVVGVVGDVPGETVRDGPSRAIYFPNIFPPRAATVTGALHIYIPSDEVYVVRTRAPASAIMPTIRRAVREVDPKLVITRVATLDDLVADSLAQARLTMLLLLVGAATSLFLGMVGIYGVLAYAVRRRTAELGIRLALGASPREVARMVVRQGALLALAGIAGGLLAAFALTRFLHGLLYRVSPTDPASFAVAGAVLFGVALVAAHVPARRAGRIDPVRALKAE